MKLTMKKFLMFAVTFLFVMGISINVFADTGESAKNLFYAGDCRWKVGCLCIW